jgi:hypothetical protein
LDAFFHGVRLAGISGASATAYVAQRQLNKAANGTINRELAVLTKMLRLAYDGHIFGHTSPANALRELDAVVVSL